MFKLGNVVGFLPSKDLKSSRAFFESKMGLQFVSEDPYALVMQSGATSIRIARVQDFNPAPYTVLGWEVQDIEHVVSELKAYGVSLEKYPFIQDQELGIWLSPSGAKVAWFKDPDGNVLSLTQQS